MQLTEQYRPQTWADVVGQDKAVSKLVAIGKRGYGGRAYLITGASGTGKTTLARILAKQLAGELGTVEMNAADFGIDDVRDMETLWHYTCVPSVPGGPTGRAWILNECHLFRPALISRLLTTLEEIPAHVAVILTSTIDPKKDLFGGCDDANPLLSRCFPVALSRRPGVDILAAHVVSKCREAGLLNGMSDAHYIKRAVTYLEKNANNMRALYQAADAGYLTEADTH